MFEYTYDNKTIFKKRRSIYNDFNKLSNNVINEKLLDMTEGDVELLFNLYDKYFFNGDFKAYDGRFKFSLSKRMTKSAGLTLCPKNISFLKPKQVTIEFRFGVNFFLNYTKDDKKRYVSGIETNNAIEALQLVMEHEICHAIEFILYYKSSCRGERFKNISKNLFGHTSSYHQLPTNQEIAKEKYGLSIGQRVSFEYKGKILEGIISAINKRATVMVKNTSGQYVDKYGNRYIKYYVPLIALKVIE